MGFIVVCCQVDVVCVVFQISSLLFSFFIVVKRLSFLQVGMVSCIISINDIKVFVFVVDRIVNIVVVRVVCSVMFVFIQVLNSEVQVINQIKEVGVMIGSNVVNMINEEVIVVCCVIVKFRQYIGVIQCIINYIVVMVVIERINVSVFKICECQMCFVISLSVSVFRVVILEVIFLLIIIGQIGIDLSFFFKIKMGIGYVVIVIVIVFIVIFGEIMQIDSFIVQIYFVVIFVIDFCSVCSICY